MKKFLTSTAVISLSALLGVGALVGIAGRKQALKAEAASYNCSEIIINDESGWCFRTLKLGNFGYSSGYSSTDLDEFVQDYYVTDRSSSWDKQGTNRGYKKDGSTYYLCAGGSGGAGTTYSFLLPEWIEYCSVIVQNNDNDRDVNYLNNFKQTNGTVIGNGHLKSTTIYANNTGGWPSLGSAASTTDFEKTVSVVAKTNASTQVGTGSITTNKYAHYTTAFSVSGYTFQGWYTDANLTQSLTGLIGSKTTLYAKMTNLPQLSAPTLTKAADNTITWTAVANATKYLVSINGGAATEVATSATLKVDPKYYPGSYTVSVIAVGDGVNYTNSNAASESYTIDNGFYLVGSFQGWDAANLVGALRMDGVQGQANTYSVTATLAANTEFKTVYAAAGEDPEWQNNFGSLTTNPRADAQFPVTRPDVENNPTQIKVATAGEYEIRAHYENYQVNYTVLALDYEAEIKLLIGSTEVPMVLNSGTEYKAENVTLARGQTLGYKDDGTTVADSFAKVIYNNNLDSSKKVIFGATNVTVYVDINTKSIFAEGMPNVGAGYHVIKNGSSVITMTQNENPSDPSYLEYYTALTSFAANDVLTFLDKKASGEVLPVEFKISTINAAGLGSKFEVTADGIRAKEAVNTAVYLKLKSGADEVFFGEVSEAEIKAEQFAENFLTAINAVCDSQGITTDTAALATAWAGQVTAFGSLISGAQDILKAATDHDSVEAIRNFIAQYTYVLTKYGKHFDASTRDFLNKGITPNAAPNGYLFADSMRNSTTIIAIVVIVAVVGVSGALVIKFRKHS